MADGNNALAEKTGADKSPARILRGKLDQWFKTRLNDMVAVLGTPDKASKFYVAALQAIQRSPDLLEADPQTLALCIFTSAQLGLKPGPSQECAYVTFNNKGRKEATFIPMYKGLIKLATNTGRVESIYAEVVHEHDKFHFERGLHPRIDHSWILGQTRGEMVGAYAVAKMSGGDPVSVILEERDIEAIRAKSRGAKSDFSPWNTDEFTEAEMWKKTAIKRIAKILPMDDERFDSAIEIDHAAERPDLAKRTITPLIGDDDGILQETAGQAGSQQKEGK